MDKIKKFEDFLDRMKGLLDNAKRQGHIIVRVEDLENTFPELKESEDERMRKLCEVLVRSCFVNELCTKEEKDDCIAWLEKQGEQKLDYCHHEVDLSNCSEEYRKAYYDGWNNCNMQHSQCQSESNDVVKCLINGMRFYYEDNEEAKWGTAKFSMKVKDILSWLEKQRGQKPTDKVESKFKVGDWIIFNSLRLLIKEVVQGYYRTISVGGIPNSYDWDIDNVARLWTLDDAMDGDVIFYDDGWTCIFKHIHGIWYSSYCFITADGEFHTGYEEHAVDSTINGNAHPATKEQRDLLFQKMKEAGFTFDFDKKELKEIEQKPTDKVESKFKVGDCVVDNCGYVWRIEGRLNEFYILEGIDGGESRPTIEWVNNTFHLWTIQDAKDGDVLAVDNMIFIYKRTLASHIVSYCKLINDIFEPFDDARTCCEGNPYVHPATKEQRGTLMKAMADAGYTFEFEKKELNKIEQNLDWGEEIEIGG